MAIPSRLVIPLLLAACGTEDSVTTELRCEASPGSGFALDYDIGHMRLQVDDITIGTPNGAFFDSPTGLQVGENGDAETGGTLELEWQERGADMRLYVYYERDASDWFVDEIRHYNGAVEGNWIYYQGDLVRCPLGQYARGDLALEGDNDDGDTGSLQLANFSLGAAIAP